MQRLAWLVGLSACLAACGWAWGQGPDATTESAPGAPRPTTAKPNKKSPMAVTPEREAAVRTFVERNHPELSGLLAHLKESQPREYERAVRELHRVTERLAGIQERDPLQYELELKLWTAQSEVQLLAARLKMGQTREIKDQLRQALGAQADAKVALLKHEKSRVADRLGKIERDITRFEGEREQVIENQLQLLTRGEKSQKTARPARSTSKAAVRSGKVPSP
jgi:hypothetical protein